MTVNSLLKGTRGNAATTHAGWDFNEASTRVGNTAEVPSSYIYSVTRNARVAAIKQRRGARVVCPLRPVVIGQISLVSALVAQCLLPSPHEVPVPREEVSLVEISIRMSCSKNRMTNIAMRDQCQSDVGHDEVIVTVLCSGGNCRRCPGLLLAHTLNSFDVV
jgi:hypothetical protein